VLFLVDSCIPARQWTDICNARCSILSRFSHFHVSHFPPLQAGAANSCLAFSTPATWWRIFISSNFMSRIFSVPSWIFSPGVCERITGRRGRTTIRRGHGAATSDVPTVGLAPGGRTERSATHSALPLSMASATAMPLDSAHRLTDQTHPLSIASATTMSPDSPQFPDLHRRTDSLRHSQPAFLTVSAAHVDLVDQRSTVSLRLTQRLCRSHKALNSTHSHCSITKAADDC